MKSILLVLPTFAALYVAACSSYYKFCHCYDANGLPNNNATREVCNDRFGNMLPDTKEYPHKDPTPYYECGVKFDSDGWNNC